MTTPSPVPRAERGGLAAGGTVVYLVRVQDDGRRIHLSLVPPVPGLDTLCGTVLTAMVHATTVRGAFAATGCAGCRDRLSTVISR